MTEVMISILVLRIGNLKKLQVAKGSSVQDVLSLINAPKDLYTGIYINGAEQSKEAILKDGDKLGLYFPIRGEVTIKRSGYLWRVHKADPDDQFPCDFHAHNVSAPETLNLYTGEVYDSRSKTYIRNVPKKIMRDIFRKLSTSNEEEIRNRCVESKSRFVFLEKESLTCVFQRRPQSESLITATSQQHQERSGLTSYIRGCMR